MTTLQIIQQLLNGDHLSETELKEAQNLVYKLDREIKSRLPREIDFTRINNDGDGNPRFVCHFLNLLTDKDNDALTGDISAKYARALMNAKKIGGRKFDNKQYGGGIVFNSVYNLTDLNNKIFQHLKTL